MKKNKILLSVITVVYNSEKYIKSAIDSVILNKSESIEYIIVDGNSNDSTIDIIKSYGSSISKFSSEPDNGIYDAMNKGMHMADGEYISYLNSDDLYVDGALLKIVKILSNENPDVLYTNLEIIDSKNNVKRFWRPGTYKKNKLKKLWIPPHPTTVIKKKLMTKIGGFNTNYKLAADYDLLLRVLKMVDKIIYVDIVATKMRLGGVTNNSWKNILNQNIEIFKSYKSQFKKYPTFQILFKIYDRLLQFLIIKIDKI